MTDAASAVTRLGLPLLPRLLQRVEVDRAVFFTIAARAWQAGSSPVTVLVIGSAFSPVVQGYYYTFGSLLALQSLIELGFFLVVTNVASHEWSHLRLGAGGAVEGDPDALSRIRSLFRLVVPWYAVVALVCFVVVSFAGLRFLAWRAEPGVTWRGPWLALVATQALLLWSTPLVALLEGCDRVENVSRYRLRETLLTSAALWAACLLGLNLWTAVVVNGAYLANTALFLGLEHRRFFRSIAQRPAVARVSWKREVWPMQWRVAIGAASAFAFALFTPIMFHYHGAAVAGQMGMTLQAMTALYAVGLAWVQTRAPRYGILVAQREWGELDRFWLRNSRTALCVVLLGSAAAWAIVFALQHFGARLGSRFLPAPAVAFVFGTAGLMVLSGSLLAYLRAHKREPVVVWATVVGLAAGLQMWVVGGRLGAVAGAIGHFALMAVAVVWLLSIWRRCRRDWHDIPAS